MEKSILCFSQESRWADWTLTPEGHLAYFISDSVDSLDLSAFHARYAKGGPRNQPFHPAMMVKVLIYGYPQTAAMDIKLKTPEGQAAYRKRKWIVEAPNEWIKNVLGFRQFSLRGLQKVQAEFKLVSLALNLRR